MKTETEIDWRHVMRESEQGRLMPVLQQIPQEMWITARMRPYNWSLLIHACKSDGNIRALLALLKKGADINEDPRAIFRNGKDNKERWSPLLEATLCLQPRTIQVLLALQADPLVKNHHGSNALEEALLMIVGNHATPEQKPFVNQNCIESAKVLIANGFRLQHINQDTYDIATARHSKHIDFGKFEQGVINCRDIIVTLLGLKKRRHSADNYTIILPKLDRFLIRQVLAVEIWTTRTNEKWQK